MSTKHNEKFNLDVYASNSEAARVSNNVNDFTSQFVGSQAEPIAVNPGELGERDNDIYNLGVEDGAVNFLNHLYKKGYQIIDPEGTRIEPAQGSSFAEDYFSTRYWNEVNS